MMARGCQRWGGCGKVGALQTIGSSFMEGYNFDEWNFLKQRLDDTPVRHFCREREIWICAIGKNIGREQNGKREMFQRPVLVIRKFGSGIFFGVPLTSTVSQSDFVLQISGGSFLVLSQMRIFDMRRLIRKTRRLEAREFEIILAQLWHVIAGK